ncbi:MAG: hypothetical protein EBV03_06055 [Proteobacteria bacterium]|nr:hypothetical protein [Pseudomonadota bacterium]
MPRNKRIALLALFLPLVACTPQEMYQHEDVKEAQVTDRTRAGAILEKLPPAKEKVAVALYDFQDMTGQFKFNGNYSDFSSAVTKGGLSILMKALLDSGNKKWFTVTERSGLKNLLQERQIIKVMRGEYRNPQGEKLPDLPPLVYGGMLLEGGIIGYDSNVITGGAGAIYLGIGGNTRYARDVITVYLRAVNIQTGEVLMSVTSSKTIFSTAVNANVLKYITFDKLLQAEAGFSLNEPVMLATRQAIETAVYSMIMEGAIDGLWEFGDAAAGQVAIAEYKARRDKQNVLPSEKEQHIFERALSDDFKANRARAEDDMVRQEPLAMAAQTMPVASQPLPPEPQPVPQAAPMPQQAAPMPQQAVTMPVGMPDMAPAAGGDAGQPRVVSQMGPGSVSGWGSSTETAAELRPATAAAMPPTVQPTPQPATVRAAPRYAAVPEPAKRQRFKENYYHLVY